MNLRANLAAFSILGGAVCASFAVGTAAFNPSVGPLWAWRLVPFIVAIPCIWIDRREFRRDNPEHPSPPIFKTGRYRFAVIAKLDGNQIRAKVTYLNRYAGHCTAVIRIHPCASTDTCQRSGLLLRIDRQANGGGPVEVSWGVTNPQPDLQSSCDSGAELFSPQDSQPQPEASSINLVVSADADSDNDHTLTIVTTGRMSIKVPQRAVNSSTRPSKRGKPRKVYPEIEESTTRTIGFAVVEVTRIGLKDLSVVCPHCAHSYLHTVLRRATANRRDTDLCIARRMAEKDAETELKMYHARINIVQCPECKGLNLA